MKTQMEVEETTKSCPFKPQLPKSNKKPSLSQTKEESAPLPERLLHEADLRKEKREKLKREHEL